MRKLKTGEIRDNKSARKASVKQSEQNAEKRNLGDAAKEFW